MEILGRHSALKNTSSGDQASSQRHSLSVNHTKERLPIQQIRPRQPTTAYKKMKSSVENHPAFFDAQSTVETLAKFRVNEVTKHQATTTPNHHNEAIDNKVKTLMTRAGLIELPLQQSLPSRTQTQWLSSDYRDAYIGTYCSTLNALSSNQDICHLSYRVAEKLCQKFQEYNMDFPLKIFAKRIAYDAGKDAIIHFLERT